MKRTLSLACMLCLAGILLWAAGPPQVVNYQGVLRCEASLFLQARRRMRPVSRPAPTPDSRHLLPR